MLGRAMERARRTGEKPPEGRPRDEFHGTTGDLLASPFGLVCIALAGAGACWAATLFWDEWYPMTLGLGAIAILLCSAVLLGRWHLGSAVKITVGADGVLVKGRFIPYSMIVSVDRECQHHRDEDNNRAFNLWIASLRLAGGERVHLWQGTSQGLHHHSVTEITNAVEEARAAWCAAHAGPGVEEGLLRRGDRTSIEWVHSLRRAGSAAAGVYRNAGADGDRMSSLLDDAHAEPSARAAAAVALSACGDPTAPKRLRIAAASMANPRLRVALEKVASASDDAALAEALEAVIEADRLRAPAREPG